jgi:H+/Cl- antiporter ClcA
VQKQDRVRPDRFGDAAAERPLGDFTATWHKVALSGLAVVLGGVSAVLALALLRLIGVCTNLFFYGRWDTTLVSPVDNDLGVFVVLVPVAGALAIGVMARLGSERIRGHGIPEAIEAILIGGSRVQPRVAVLLAVELLLFEWKPRSLVPVALASATAAILRKYLLGLGPLFPTPPHPAFIGPGGLALCVAAGLLAGGLSALLTMTVYAAEDAFLKLPIDWMWWPAIGGLTIGVGGLVFPEALGVGYDVIERMIRGIRRRG